MSTSSSTTSCHLQERQPWICLSAKEEDSAFNSEVKDLLNQINLNPIGARLIAKLRLLSRKIFIFPGAKDLTASNSFGTYISLTLKDFNCYSPTSEAIFLPKHVILFHELTHAYHHLSNKQAWSNQSDPLVWESDEEYKTIIGFPSKSGKTSPKITENAFRQAEGLPLRYGSYGPSEGIRSLLAAHRGKILGSIYERQLSESPENFSPPPMAQCTMEDLGSEHHCLALITVAEDENQIRDFLCFDFGEEFERELENKIFKYNHSASQAELNEIASKYAIPNLENKVVKSAIKVRLSIPELIIACKKAELS